MTNQKQLPETAPKTNEKMMAESQINERDTQIIQIAIRIKATGFIDQELLTNLACNAEQDFHNSQGSGRDIPDHDEIQGKYEGTILSLKNVSAKIIKNDCPPSQIYDKNIPAQQQFTMILEEVDKLVKTHQYLINQEKQSNNLLKRLDGDKESKSYQRWKNIHNKITFRISDSTKQIEYLHMIAESLLTSIT